MKQGGLSGGGIGRPALLIGVITGVANVVGFGRQLVFAHTVGATSLGTAYATANQVPNIIYAIVLGGALTGMVVPVLAGPALAGVKTDTRQTSSALITWTLLLLVPVSVAVAAVAHPVVSLLLGHPASRGADASMLATGSRMLAVFAPQIALYGLAVVGYGILQAHRRFAAPALAPVLSSIVVASAYFAFVPLDHGQPITALPRAAELMLSIGTTAGVAALAVTALVPVRRLRLGLRPTLHFPPGVAARVRALAVAGVAAVVAQNVSTAVVIVLANVHGGSGALVLYNYGWQVFFVPYAVLAVPIATSAFPVLSASAANVGTTAPESQQAPPPVPGPAGAAAAGPDSDATASSGTGSVSASPPDFDGAVASSGGGGSAAGRPATSTEFDSAVASSGGGGSAAGRPATSTEFDSAVASSGGGGSAAGRPATSTDFDGAVASSGGGGSAAGRRAASTEFDSAVASSTRAATLASWLGAALLIGACVPAARVFLSHNTVADRGPATELAWALAAFAPGLAGFGLAANLSRVLFACRRTRIAAAAITGGWILVIAADLVIVPLVSRSWVVPALGLGNTIGLTVAGAALLAAVHRARGPAALRGVPRACGAGLVGALAGAAAGVGLSAALRVYGFLPNVAVVLLACVCATLAFALVTLALDGGEMRSLLTQARARLAR
ncbi:MAG TPA: lipid II flippase MurJ [Streptosporangiaceae bacterium]